MNKYRIYYADGTTVDSDVAIEDTPAYGVVCILQQRGYDEKYFITSQSPYYIYVDGEWLPAWMNDIEDYLANRLGAIEKFLVGRIIPKYKFMEIYEQAKADRANEALD